MVDKDNYRRASTVHQDERKLKKQEKSRDNVPYNRNL